MAELVYTRVSSDEQSTTCQTRLLAEAGLVDGAAGVRLFADSATSSKPPRSNAKFSPAGRIHASR